MEPASDRTGSLTPDHGSGPGGSNALTSLTGPVFHARRYICAVASMILSIGFTACGDVPQGPTPDDLRARFELEALGLPPYPPDNPRTQSRIELGRLLFFDPILGGERDVSCGTCHHPDFAFADGRQFGAGVSGVGLGPARQLSNSAISGNPMPEEPRNTQTILNAAYGQDALGTVTHLSPLFWDGRAMGLEEQALMPLASRVEMRGDAFAGSDAEAAAVAVDSITQRVAEIAQYVDLFREAFSSEGADTAQTVVTASRLARALAAYQRELMTINSPYDRFVLGDDDALDVAQRRGLEIFFTTGKCTLCHRGATFSNFLFRVTAAPQEGPGKTVIPGDDTGREEHTGRIEDRYAFRVPSLRNVELTAPYMHAGVFGTLEEVLGFYNGGGRPRNPNVPEERIVIALRDSLGLSSDDMADVIHFLSSLTDPGSQLDPLLLSVPLTVPSGLTPVVGISALQSRPIP